MKKLALFLIGFFPLLLGFLNSSLMGLFSVVISLIILILWFFAGMISTRLSEKRAQALLLLNAAGIIYLLLLSYQLITEQDWVGTVGQASKLYFLPLIGTAFQIMLPIGEAFTYAYLRYSYIGAFLLTLLVSYLGRIYGERRIK
jgi:hypothetical protein